MQKPAISGDMCCTKFLHPPDQNICLAEPWYRAPNSAANSAIFPLWFLKLDITPRVEWSSLTFSCEHSAILGRLHHAETGAAYCNRTALFDFTKEGLCGFVEMTKASLNVDASVCLELSFILSVKRGDTKDEFLYSKSLQPKWAWVHLEILVPALHSRWRPTSFPVSSHFALTGAVLLCCTTWKPHSCSLGSEIGKNKLGRNSEEWFKKI